MKPKINRRHFVKRSTQAGVAGCLLMMSPRLLALENLSGMFGQDVPDPKKMNTFCTYNCNSECQFMQASVKNDPELKKKVYDEWKLADRVGEFDADKLFCFGCKVEESKIGPLIKTCSVRNCCLEKGFEACIECDGLEACKKDLWTKYPDFHKMVIDLRKKYVEAQG